MVSMTNSAEKPQRAAVGDQRLLARDGPQVKEHYQGEGLQKGIPPSARPEEEIVAGANRCRVNAALGGPASGTSCTCRCPLPA